MGCVLSDLRRIALRQLAKNVLIWTARSFFRILFSLGNGIVAARIERIATDYSPRGKSDSYEKSPFHKRLNGILGAGRTKSARWLTL